MSERTAKVVGYIIEFSDGERAYRGVYQTIENAEKKAVQVFEQTSRPTRVVDERYRKNGRAEREDCRH